MSKILIFTEFQSTSTSASVLKRSAQELLQFAAATGRPVVALAFGTQAANAFAQLAHHGAQEVLLCKDPSYDAIIPNFLLSP